MRTKFNGSFLDSSFATKDAASRKKLIDKVVKLFALADSTTHQDEANSAREMAATLLAKHNIQMGEIAEDEFVVITEQRGKKEFQHTKILYIEISQFCGVQLITCPGRGFRYVGTRSSIETFRHMIKVVLDQRDHAYAKRDKDCTETRHKWMSGFAYGVKDKCRELSRTAKQKVQERGLVIVSEAEQAAAWYKRHNQVRSSRIRGVCAGAAGYKAGSQVQLNKDVSQQTNTPQIGA